MNDLSRRGAMLAMASGAATSVVLAATTSEASMQGAKNEQKTEDILLQAITSAAAFAGPFEAAVVLSRSWDTHVYLVLDNGVKGYASLEPYGHGIAAACQAAGRKVFMRYDANDPNWGNGAGYFTGVRVALDRGAF